MPIHQHEKWDVIIVGARCAGSTLATLLARQGVKTLILEAKERGSDMLMSTHLIQPAGIDVMESIGLVDKIRASTPASTCFRIALDDVAVLSRFSNNRAAYCVRRNLIDGWLQESAEASGAELRDQHRVVDLLREGERVVGVVATNTEGNKVRYYANLVVGADGVNSTIAKLTNAKTYLVSEDERAGYWGYFEAPAQWNNAWDATLEHIGQDMRYVFRTNDNALIMVYLGPKHRFDSWSKDKEAELIRVLGESPATAPLIQGKKPLEKLMGRFKSRFFYREAVGPGYALIGDAGHFKHFVTGQGMADAFLDAQRLSKAVIDGREESMKSYWYERDAETIALHFDSIRQAELDFNNSALRALLKRIANKPELANRLAQIIDRERHPTDIAPNSIVLKTMMSALMKGRFDIVAGLFKENTRFSKEAKLEVQWKKRYDTAKHISTTNNNYQHTDQLAKAI